MINKHYQQQKKDQLTIPDMQRFFTAILKDFQRQWKVFRYLCGMWKKLLIVILCCVVIYVLAFICLSRLSLRIQNALYYGPLGTIVEERCDEYYYLPYTGAEIATNARLEFLFWKLVFIFHPLERLDYLLTGYHRGGIPMMGFFDVKTDIVPESLRYLTKYAISFGSESFGADWRLKEILNNPIVYGELAMVAQQVRLNKDYNKIVVWLEEYPMEDHEIASRIYYLFRLFDILEFKYE